MVGPVSRELIAMPRNGEWRVHLTPRPVPQGWLGDALHR